MVWHRISELGANALVVLAAKCLTYGLAPASNIKQEISWALLSIVVDLFEAEEAPRFARETDPPLRLLRRPPLRVAGDET